MSAGTMLAGSADEIIMGKHSFLGPTDPQIIFQIGNIKRSNPAHAILSQFEKAKDECKEDQKNIGVWLPMLKMYDPSLLIECKNAIELSKKFVKKWLKKYMFKNDDNNDEIAEKISNYFSDHDKLKSHGRHIGINKAKKLGLKINVLEDDQKFQDLVLSIFHATTITFDGTPCVKIIENHHGNVYISKLLPIPPPLPPLPSLPKPQ